MSGPRMNLQHVTSLIVDRDHYTRGLIAQMLRGFGMESPMLVDNGEQAKAFLTESRPDIVFVEGDLADMPSDSPSVQESVALCAADCHVGLYPVADDIDGQGQRRAYHRQEAGFAANAVRSHFVGRAPRPALS
jgi:hypothetical protein